MVAPNITENKKAGSKVNSYKLSLEKRLTIGRSDSCKITIKKPEISSFHAVVYYEEESFWLVDNDSANGTTLNGQSVKGKNKLKFNDLIKIGDYSFNFVGEYDYNEGKTFFLEIFKGKLNENSKTQKLKTTSKKKKEIAPSKIEKKKGKGKNRYLHNLKSDMVNKLKEFNHNHQKMANSIKKFVTISLIFHLLAIYLLGKFFVDTKPGDETREIVLSLQEQQPIVKLPDVPQVEIPEPEIQQETNDPVIKVDLQSSANSSIDSLSNTSDDVLISDSANATLDGVLGDIQVGKGYKGVQDASFTKRLIKAKGRFKDVDVRLTLIWNGFSDLDLHAMTPSLQSIFHGQKSIGNGELDIDKNASKPVNNPVENIIWTKADDGEFTVSVVLFDPRRSKADIPFKIEFKIFGDVYYYKGRVKNDDSKDPLEIVKFACRDGKYKILKSINDRVIKYVEEELDLVIEE